MSSTAVKEIISAGAAATTQQSKAAGLTNMRVVADKVRKATDWVAANPGKTAALGAVGAGAVLVAAPMAAAVPLLGAAGFSSSGIVAGSAAAAAQSSIGNVAAASAFATLQSAAAGGYGVATVSAYVQGVGGVAASSGLLAMFKKKKNEENENGPAVEKDEDSTLLGETDEEGDGRVNDSHHTDKASL
ncbi:hypothetical protein F4859DRAFT_128716 [Xylaria cf. heliscus]|nr:hypothetical protein F4859DRAFT_128716 [Xylaria cf. heliscus]